MKRAKDNKGITLITIIIAVIIMAILVGVTTYSGVESYKKAKVVKFVSEMQLIQGRVDEIANDKNKTNELIEHKQTNLQIVEKAYQNEEIPFDVSIEYNSEYKNQFKLFTIDDLKNELDIENIDTDVLINFNTREVIAINGVEHEGKTYYTQYKLPNGQALFLRNGERVNFGFDIEKRVDGLNCLVNIVNASPNAKLFYVEQEYNDLQEEWENIGEWQTLSKYTRTGEEYSVNITKSGVYAFKLEDNTQQNSDEIERIKIITTNEPKSREEVPIYDYASENSEDWAWIENEDEDIYVWIPRLAINNSTDEIKFIKGNSNIATDNTYINNEEWAIPDKFSNNSLEYTGIWVKMDSKTEIDILELLDTNNLEIKYPPGEYIGQVGQVNNQFDTALQIGDFIRYGNETWCVFYNDQNGLQIVSLEVKKTKQLSGIKDFEDRVNILNSECKQYVKKEYGGLKARVPGYTFNILDADTSKSVYLDVNENELKKVILDSRDTITINLETQNANTVFTRLYLSNIPLPSNYWMTSYNHSNYTENNQIVITDFSCGVNFFNGLTSNTETENIVNYSYNTKTLTENAATHGILPIVLLDRRITITDGDGTYANPYVYEFNI